MTAREHQGQEQILAGKYRLRRLLKEGGMGSVYVAEEIATGRRVAVKRLREDASDNPEAVDRLYNEARAASAVGHPGIVEVLELDVDDEGVPFLAMELLQGQSLDELLQERGKLDPELAVDIVAQTLSALAAAHDKGIIHRDLKPENIFITEIPEGERHIKILDFGISKVWREGVPLNLTQTGTVWGTPYYMSPEHARGAKDLDGQTDIWAMGVILYQTLTGQLPYEGETYNELLAKILGEPFPRPRELDPSIPRALEQVVLTAMAKDRRYRYETTAGFRQELLASIHGSGPGRWLAGAVSLRPGARGRPARSRPWALVAIALVLVLGAVTGLYLSGVLSRPEVSANPTTETARPGPTGPPGEVDEPGEREPITIRLDHVPEGVDVRVDGELVTTGSFQRPRGERPARLQLFWRGRIIAESTIELDRGRAIDVAATFSDAISALVADAGARPEAGAGPTQVRAKLVKVRVLVLPPSAVPYVRVDGRHAPQGTAKVASGRPHRITVSAPGYQRVEIHRRIHEDTVVEVRLVAEEGATVDGQDEVPRYQRRDVEIVTEYPQ